jgi:hypothetical protein
MLEKTVPKSRTRTKQGPQKGTKKKKNGYKAGMFSSLFRPCSAGDVFESSLAHFGSLLAPFWLPFGILLVPFGSFLGTLS